MEISDWTRRQLDLVDKWYYEYNCIGTLIAYTAWGKSSGFSIPAIKKYNPKKLIVAVPSTKLKLDWENRLLQNDISANVIIVNTLIKNNYITDLLIIDECHRFASNEFSKTFEVVKYNKLLCLTASLERNDGKHQLILNKAPLLDTITLQEGLTKGWLDNFEIIKIPISLTEEEEERLNKINLKYNSVKKSLGFKNPMEAASFYISYIDLTKWVISKKTNKVYFVKYIQKQTNVSPNTKIFNKYFNYPTKEHSYFKMAKLAIDFYNIVGERKNLLYNAKNKLSKAASLLNTYKDSYSLLLAQRIEFLDQLCKLLPKNSYSIYHSKLSNKEKEKNYQLFIDDNTKVKKLLSVKSLIEGIDIPKLEILLITSFTSSTIDKIQSFGRVLRKYKNKTAKIIYLYIPNTQEEVWLNKLKI